MREELKPCPFCGGKAWLYDANNDEGFNVPPGNGTFYVRCKDGCGHLMKDREDAIKVWNKPRTPDLSTMREALDDAEKALKSEQDRHAFSITKWQRERKDWVEGHHVLIQQIKEHMMDCKSFPDATDGGPNP